MELRPADIKLKKENVGGADVNSIIPISDYPAPSDANSQIQVLNEKKGEINGAIDIINNSKLGRKTKEIATDRLRARRDSIETEIRHKRTEKQVKDKIEKRQREEKEVIKAQLEKQDKDTSKARLDIRA